MPATERSFLEFPPARLYVDTDFLLSFLVPTEQHHDRTRKFLERVMEAGVTTLYTSGLLWLEFANVVVRDRVRLKLPPDFLSGVPIHERWGERLVRETYLKQLVDKLDEVLSQFDSVEVPLDAPIRQDALRFMAEYDLRPHDAAHLATAFHADVLDLASFDRGFRRVDGLYLWNDRVYAQG